MVTAQDPRHGPCGSSDLRTEDVRPATVPGPRVEDALLDLFAGSGGHRVRSGRAGLQTGVALARIPVDLRLHALARDAHRGCDMSLRPPGLVALDNQSATVNGQPSTSVEHENLRVEVGLRQATSNPEVLVPSTSLTATNVLAGYT